MNLKPNCFEKTKVRWGIFKKLSPTKLHSEQSATLAANIKVLCAVWDLLHYTFNPAPKLIKGTNAEFTTSAHIAQNTCYRLAGFSAQKLNRSTNKKSFKK